MSTSARLSPLGLLGAVLILGWAAPAAALPITLSDMSSDATPASTLDATLDFSILGGDQLQIVATNDTTAPDEFNINQIFWMGSGDVTSLTLVSATHSDAAANPILGDWLPVVTDTMVNGFGMFDFGLIDGMGETDPSVIGPTESITFVLDITGNCADALDCDAFDDFLSIANSEGKSVAAKFVNGPDDPESPGNEDSAFGASAPIPEPGSFGLGALGLLALALRRRIG